MEKESGRNLTISTIIKKLWSKEDGTGLGELSEFDRLVDEELVDDVSSPKPISSAKETTLWIAACEGHANRQIFGLAEEGITLVRTGKVDALYSSHSSSKFHTQPAVEPLKDEMKEMREEMKTLQAQ